MTRPLPEIPRYPLLTLTRHAIQTALPSGMFSESDLGLLPGDGAARLWGGAGCVCVCVWKRVLSAMAELHSCQRDPQAGLWSGCPGHGEGLPFRRASLTQEGGRVQERRAWPCGLHLAQHQQRVSRRLGMLSILAQQRAPPGSRLTKHHLILQTLSSTELHPTASCGLLACVVSAGLSPPPLIPVS